MGTAPGYGERAAFLSAGGRKGGLAVWGSPGSLAVGLAGVLPVVLFAAHAALLRDWLIDDAGITFAYARNLAHGYGLVAQPGASPVEGFSNPLWTLLVAVLFRAGLFSLDVTPKAVAFVLVTATLAIVWNDVRGARDRSAAPGSLWPAALATALLATSTAFVIWTMSGLENALLAFLAAASCALVGRAAEGEASLDRLAGVVAGLLALTRPDAVLYAAALPAALLGMGGWTRRALARWTARVVRYAGGFLPVAGAYFLYRRLHFGEWVPNTYYAKDGPSLAFLFDSSKWLGLLDAALGPLAIPAALAIVVGAVFVLRRSPREGRAASLVVHLGLAAAAYVLMPEDWMGEYRFATPFFLFFYWAVAECLRRLARLERSGTLAAAVALSLAATSATVHAARTADFVARPVVPLAEVARFYGDGYNRLAETLGAPAPSLLAPDVGGTLLTSRLRVYDLVGLCDAVAARTLRSDPAAFHRYVLEETRPTFIHVHGPWSLWAAFHSDPRFARSYVPLREAWGEGRPEAAASAAAQEPTWGDYVRKDALGGDPEAMLSRLRAAYRASGMAEAAF